ncbi:MAG TPA: hypothetical protein VMA09_23720 [Candidatus Binataceae bacterium]|nr:hypothetical protein [Candidatus Binataceae bacterium]
MNERCSSISSREISQWQARHSQHQTDGIKLHEQFVNPQWIMLLEVLNMNVRYGKCGSGPTRSGWCVIGSI